MTEGCGTLGRRHVTVERRLDPGDLFGVCSRVFSVGVLRHVSYRAKQALSMVVSDDKWCGRSRREAFSASNELERRLASRAPPAAIPD